jgi:hypothetical protein
MIKLTIEDLKGVQSEFEGVNKEDVEAEIDRMVMEVDNACDLEVKAWAKKYAVNTMLSSLLTGATPMEMIYQSMLIGLYMGARMQEGKSEQTMTVRLQFQPGGTNLH